MAIRRQVAGVGDEIDLFQFRPQIFFQASMAP